MGQFWEEHTKEQVQFMQSKLITVDGPSGVGKGTMSKKIAEKLQWHLLDSGLIYRVLGFIALELGYCAQDEVELVRVCESMSLPENKYSLVFRMDGVRPVQLGGRLLGAELRTEAVGKKASELAAIASIRKALLSLQQSFAKPPGLVADGRDMGTVVFPQAGLKFYLTASAEVRAQRRYDQLKTSQSSPNFDEILQDIRSRDDRDMNRAAAPLKPAEDAIIIDTSDLNIDAVEQQMMEKIDCFLGNIA